MPRTKDCGGTGVQDSEHDESGERRGLEVRKRHEREHQGVGPSPQPSERAPWPARVARLDPSRDLQLRRVVLQPCGGADDSLRDVEFGREAPRQGLPQGKNVLASAHLGPPEGCDGFGGLTGVN
jgi:hypothetical protein